MTHCALCGTSFSNYSEFKHHQFKEHNRTAHKIPQAMNHTGRDKMAIVKQAEATYLAGVLIAVEEKIMPRIESKGPISIAHSEECRCDVCQHEFLARMDANTPYIIEGGFSQ